MMKGGNLMKRDLGVLNTKWETMTDKIQNKDKRNIKKDAEAD